MFCPSRGIVRLTHSQNRNSLSVLATFRRTGGGWPTRHANLGEKKCMWRHFQVPAGNGKFPVRGEECRAGEETGANSISSAKTIRLWPRRSKRVRINSK